jgi:FtsH-binding integral membrane protein
MENNINLSKDNYRTEKVTYLNESGVKAISKSFMANVFMLMAGALVVSGLVAYLFATNEALLRLLITPTGLSPLGYIAIFSPLVFTLVMQFGFNRLSTMALALLFALLAIVMGMSLSFLVLLYTSSSVAICFFSSAAMFGVMAVMGYTTSKDLTTFGNIMWMGMIGIVVTSVVNFFFHSEQIDYIISVIGILVFTGITAYYVQKIKQWGNELDMDNPTAMKMAILGALLLYITFINLFMSLLRVFGRRR